MTASSPSFTLRLSAALREKVLRSGYATIADLCSIPTPELAQELRITEDQAKELAQQLHNSSISATPVTADKILEQEKTRSPITTSSSALDTLFGGRGVLPGKITEICGLSGSGKTQLGIQLCINAQIPHNIGGTGGTSIFIDTEGSFVAKRAAQIASACSERIYSHDIDSSSDAHAWKNKLMTGILYYRVHSPMELVAMFRMLDVIIKENPKTKLVVVDSISYLFRSNFSDTNARTKIVATLGRQLASLARKFDIAIVAMNQMSTKIESHQDQKTRQGGDQLNSIHPSLGDSWGNICTHRVQLHIDYNGNRSAKLFKSPSTQEQSVAFAISSDGIMDTNDSPQEDTSNYELEDPK